MPLRSFSIPMLCALACVACEAGGEQLGIGQRRLNTTTVEDCALLLSTMQSQGGVFSLGVRCPVTSPVLITKSTHITGVVGAMAPGFDVSGDGRFVIKVPGGTKLAPSFSIRDLELRWQRPDITDGGATRLITFLSSGVLVEESSIVADVQHPVANRHNHGPPAWLFTFGGYPSGTLSDITLLNNHLESRNWYTTGVSTVYSAMRLENIQLTKNRIRGLHGGFYLINCHDCLVARNRLFRVSWGNIVASGERIQIEDNQLLFPGNGTSGDGITLGSVVDTTIMGNQIINGSCYGIAVREATRLTIKSNLITHDVSSAIFIHGVQGKTNDVLIKENHFADNNGYGIVALYVDGLDIRFNTFRGLANKSVLFWGNSNQVVMQNWHTTAASQRESNGENLVTLPLP